MPVKYFCDGCSSQYLKKELNMVRFRTKKDADPENNFDYMFCNACYETVVTNLHSTMDGL